MKADIQPNVLNFPLLSVRVTQKKMPWKISGKQFNLFLKSHRSKPGHIQKYVRWKSLVPKLPSVTGRKIIRSLNKLGFIIVRQRGSHVFMQREDTTVTVPLHDPVKKTTLKSILNQAGVSLKEFLENL